MGELGIGDAAAAGVVCECAGLPASVGELSALTERACAEPMFRGEDERDLVVHHMVAEDAIRKSAVIAKVSLFAKRLRLGGVIEGWTSSVAISVPSSGLDVVAV